MYNFSKSFLSLSEYSEEKSFTESHENSSNFSSLGFDVFLATGFLTSSFFETFTSFLEVTTFDFFSTGFDTFFVSGFLTPSFFEDFTVFLEVVTFDFFSTGFDAF